MEGKRRVRLVSEENNNVSETENSIKCLQVIFLYMTK